MIWSTQYLGEWQKPTEREIFLEALAREYHSRCDEFDDSVCTGRSKYTGDSIPYNSYEGSRINKHAAEVLKELTASGRRQFNISREELFKAIQGWRLK